VFVPGKTFQPSIMLHIYLLGLFVSTVPVFYYNDFCCRFENLSVALIFLLAKYVFTKLGTSPIFAGKTWNMQLEMWTVSGST